MAIDASTDDHGEADGIQESLLANACRRRDLFQVQSLLRDKADANERNAAGATPLLEAAAGGDVNVVALLLGYAADVELRSKSGFEPDDDRELAPHIRCLFDIFRNRAKVEVKREALSSLPVALDPAVLAQVRNRLGLGGRQGGGIRQGGMPPLASLRKRTPMREAEPAADHSIIVHLADALRPVLVVSPLWQQATATVVLLHSLSQSGQMLEHMARELAQRLPHVRFVAPTAPTITSIFPWGVCPAWFQVASEVTPGKWPPNIKESLEEVMDIVALEKKKGIVPERIVIAGFSMGGIMAAHVALTAHHQFGGLCLMGTLGFSDETVQPGWRPAHGLPVLQVHGKLDRLAAFDSAKRNADVLRSWGCKVQFAAYEDVGHTVSAKMLEDIRDWLTRRLPDPSVAKEISDAAAWVDSDNVETSVERNAAKALARQNTANVEQNVAKETQDSSGAQCCQEATWMDRNATEAAVEHNAAKEEVERNAAEEPCNNFGWVDYSVAETAAKQNAVELAEQNFVETDTTEADQHQAALADLLQKKNVEHQSMIQNLKRYHSEELAKQSRTLQEKEIKHQALIVTLQEKEIEHQTLMARALKSFQEKEREHQSAARAQELEYASMVEDMVKERNAIAASIIREKDAEHQAAIASITRSHNVALQEKDRECKSMLRVREQEWQSQMQTKTHEHEIAIRAIIQEKELENQTAIAAARVSQQQLEDLRHEASLCRGDAHALQRLERTELEKLVETLTYAQERARMQLKKMLERERQCVVCMEQEVQIVLNPCGHYILCNDCAHVLNTCPSCRQAISSKLQVFR